MSGRESDRREGMTPTLLVADSSPTTRRLLDLACASQGITVVGVADGQQAIDCLRGARPDAALISSSLQKISALDVVSYVRSQWSDPPLPVLLLVGAFEPIDEDRVRQAGAAGVVHKPFEPAQVIGRINELLGRPFALAPADPGVGAPPRIVENAGMLRLTEEWFGQEGSGSSADAFAALLAETQGIPAPSRRQHALLELSDDAVDRIAERVAERLAQSVFGESFRQTVNDVSERLVREEIQRIRAASYSNQQ